MNVQDFSSWVSLLIEIHVNISCLQCLWEYSLLAELAVDRSARSSDLKEWGEYVDRR